jgi:hypothetical protein
LSKFRRKAGPYLPFPYRFGALVSTTRTTAPAYHVALDTPLLALSPNDTWTVRDACEGTLILGGTGSGKSSGSFKAIFMALLRVGAGGLVCCTKTEDADRIEEIARHCGRERSILRMSATGPYTFNILSYLMRRPADEGGGVEAAVSTLMEILEAGHARQGGRSGGNDTFWVNATRQLLSHSCSAIWHAWGIISLDMIVEFVASAPQSSEQMKDEEWLKTSFHYKTLMKLGSKPAIPISPREAEHDWIYFSSTLARLDSRTRSNIVITLLSELSPFLKGPLYRLFSTGTNVVPEMTHEGVILVLDLSVKDFDHTGIVAQKLVKYLWQKAAERRVGRQDTRPIVLLVDEAQYYLSKHDLSFQATARSKLVATVYATQNLPSLYAKLDGDRPQDTADALAGNFQTKIFHSNTDPRTNTWAADTIGKELQFRRNASEGSSENDTFGVSDSTSLGTGDTDTYGWNTSRGRGSSFSVNRPSGGQGPASVSFGMTENEGSGRSGGRSRSRSTNYSHGTTESMTTGKSRGRGWSEQMDYVIQPGWFTRGLRQGGPQNQYLVDGLLLQANRRFAATGTCIVPVTFQQR